MDFWAESQGHLPHYKFNSAPSRSFAQNYHDRQLAPKFPVYYGDQQHRTINPGYWPSRDVPNWTNQETNNTTPSQNFPFSLGHPIQHHYSNVGDQQRQEAGDWTAYQQQQDRGMQREGWSYNPHCKWDHSKRNEGNFRELEAWALRYSHSLPRRRRIEAELRGARQDPLERSDTQRRNTCDTPQWDRACRPQASTFCQNTSASPGCDFRDKLSYQTKLCNQPPNYIAPPSYSVQFRSVSTLHRIENENKLQREIFERCPPKPVTPELDTLSVNRQVVQERPNNEAAKVIEGRKFKLNKKAGGMTIFCLVSRIADTESKSEPISQNKTVRPNSSLASPPLKQADEVDFKVTLSKHAKSPFSKLQAIPICQESLSKLAEKSAPKKKEVSACEKLAAQSKFPLWRRPSFTNNAESGNALQTGSRETLDCNLREEENDTKSTGKTDQDGAQRAKDNTEQMMDTTCVVVKADVLQGPKKEQVHYLGSDDLHVLDSHGSPMRPNTDQPEDFDMLDAQEAEDHSVDEKTEREAQVLKILGKRRNRICGLCNSTIAQLQDEVVDLDVKELHREQGGNEAKVEPNQKELQNVSAQSETKHRQPEARMQIFDTSYCKEELIGGRDLEKDNEAQNSKMADDVKQEPNENKAETTQHGEPVQNSRAADISDTLGLSEEEWHDEVLPTEGEQVHKQKSEQLDEVADTESIGVIEDNTVQPTLVKESLDLLSDSLDDDLNDKNTNDEPSNEDYDRQNLIGNNETDKPSQPDLMPGQRDDVSCSNSVNIEVEEDYGAMLQANANQNMRQFDSGAVEDMPVLEIESESVQNQDRLIEGGTDDMHHLKPENDLKADISCKKGVTNEEIEAASGDLEIQTAGKIFEIYDTQGGECTAITDPPRGKEQPAAIKDVQADIDKASTIKDYAQDPRLDSFHNLKGEALGKEEGLSENNLEEQLSCIEVNENENNEQQPVIDLKVEVNLEDVEQSQNKEVIDNEAEQSPADRVTCELVLEAEDITSHPEMLEGVLLKDNQKCDQETKKIDTSYLVKKPLNEEAAIETAQEQETLTETCMKGTPEVILVTDDPRAKESRTENDTEVMGHISVIMDTIGELSCEVQELDSQDCEWGESSSNIGVDDNEKSDQSTNDRDEGLNETRLVCLSDSTANDNPAVSESSATARNRSVEPTSTCDFGSAGLKGKENYPTSLWDAVNRIRKHTAPDSENEEEEVTDSWDRLSLADSFVSYDHVLDQGYVDLMENPHADPCHGDGNLEDDTLSQCSKGSQGSDGTIVDDLEEDIHSEPSALCPEDHDSNEEEET